MPGRRARHERERTRTRERALLALQQVVEATEQALPPPAARMRCTPLAPAPNATHPIVCSATFHHSVLM